MFVNKILGREPAVFFGLIASTLLVLIQFVPRILPDPVGINLTGALNGVVLAGAGLATAAYVDSEKVLPALTGLVTAVFAAFLAYGTPVPESTQTAILAAVAPIVAFFVRGKVWPPLDHALGDRLAGAFENGYQSGQDDMTAYAKPVRADDEAVNLTKPASGSIQGESGAHGMTDVMPRIGEVTE
jgi:hypothetical protein